MKAVAVTSEQMLETVLYRLQTTGWARINFEKLVDTYADFRFRARRCIYHLQSGPALRVILRACLENDVAALVRQGRAIRTIDRIWLTPLGLKQAAWLTLEPARYGTLHLSAAKLFPPLTAARP